MKKVLVAGATGHLGGFVSREFKKQGVWIRALTRNTARLDHLDDDIDEKFVGEVTDPNSLKGICKDIDIVFSSIGITRQRDGLTYMDVDYQGNMNLLKGAQKAGVAKFIYISVFNAQKMKHLKGVQAKLRFEKNLKQSGLDYLIVYPNGFFSDMLEYLHMAAKGKGYVLGSGANKINPIHGEDLATACVSAAAGNEKELHIGGPEILTHNEILKAAFESLGKPIKISKIPMWLATGSLALLRRLTSAKTYGPIEFFMTVLAADMNAPAYGEHRLRDFFMEKSSQA